MDCTTARRSLSVILLLALLVPALAQSEQQKFPDVLSVEVTPTADNRFRFDVTLSSPYDSPGRYADAFRIRTRQGQTLGVRELLHHHANEQPFTRSLNNVEIPAGIEEVIVEGRDQTYGYGGNVMRARVPGR